MGGQTEAVILVIQRLRLFCRRNRFNYRVNAVPAEMVVHFDNEWRTTQHVLTHWQALAVAINAATAIYPSEAETWRGYGEGGTDSFCLKSFLSSPY